MGTNSNQSYLHWFWAQRISSSFLLQALKSQYTQIQREKLPCTFLVSSDKMKKKGTAIFLDFGMLVTERKIHHFPLEKEVGFSPCGSQVYIWPFYRLIKCKINHTFISFSPWIFLHCSVAVSSSKITVKQMTVLNASP